MEKRKTKNGEAGDGGGRKAKKEGQMMVEEERQKTGEADDGGGVLWQGEGGGQKTGAPASIAITSDS